MKNQNLLNSIYYKFLAKKFFLVYKNSHGKVKTYEISTPKLDESFGNNSEHRNNAGFRAFCFGRKEYRSFRHDRIISLTKA